MKGCFQTNTQTVYEHGESVREHTLQLIQILKTGVIVGNWRLPEWFMFYRTQILEHLLPEDIIKEYTLFHDLGKPYCLTYDDSGKRHFPNHAEESYKIWQSIGGDEQTGKLIRMDMMIHQIKALEIDEFIKNPEAITLLLSGLAEVHSNGELFGGFDSDSFKIKWSQINKRGKVICNKLFNKDIK